MVIYIYFVLIIVTINLCGNGDHSKMKVFVKKN